MECIVRDRRAYAYTGGKPFDPALPCVVFIHGAQHDHSVWALQTRWFAHHGWSVLAPDLPGHGRSAPLPRADGSDGPLTSVEAIADWVVALLDAAGVSRAMMIGHSMGSLVALETAARHPARISRLALVGAAYPMKVSETLLDAARNNEPRALEMINAWSHSTIAAKPSAPAPGFWLQGANLRLMERQRPGVLLNDFAACNAYAGGEEAAARVTCPALAVLGAADLMTPVKAGRALAARIAGCHVEVIPRCGHALMTEAPDALRVALAEFAAAEPAATPG